jgi:hypothetical protein
MWWITSNEAGDSVYWARSVKQHVLARVEDKTRELRAQLKAGRRALIIGFVILAGCLAVGWFAGLVFGDGHLPDVIRESFLILGWVAIWKPSESFLYGWPRLSRSDGFSSDFRLRQWC